MKISTAVPTLLALVLTSIGRLPAAEFIRGDVNRDGKVDLSDPIHFIYCAFIFWDCEFGPVCVDARDADDSGRLDLTDPIFTLVHLFLGGGPIPAPYPVCGEDPTEDSHGCDRYDPCAALPVGRMVAASPCGGFEDPGAGGGTTAEECVSYSLSGGILKVRHGNAGFNCCAELTADIAVSGGLIEIAESGPGICRCECLFDLDYEISGFEAGAILLRFTGSLGGPLEVIFDLEEAPAGTSCVPRSSYPWGM